MRARVRSARRVSSRAGEVVIDARRSYTRGIIRYSCIRVHLILIRDGSLTPSMARFASAHVFRGGGGGGGVFAFAFAGVANARGGGMRDGARLTSAVFTAGDERVLSSGKSLSRDSRSRSLSVFNMRLYSPTDRSGGVFGGVFGVFGVFDDSTSTRLDATGFGFGGKPGRADNPSDGVGATRGSGLGLAETPTATGRGGGERARVFADAAAFGLRRARAVVHPTSDSSASIDARASARASHRSSSSRASSSSSSSDVAGDSIGRFGGGVFGGGSVPLRDDARRFPFFFLVVVTVADRAAAVSRASSSSNARTAASSASASVAATCARNGSATHPTKSAHRANSSPSSSISTARITRSTIPPSADDSYRATSG